jgi:hypothetical protein
MARAASGEARRRDPQVQTSDGSFGIQNNQFGFNINWASGMTVVVEASTNLANPTWSPLVTNTLTLFQRPAVDELSWSFLPPALAVRRGSGSWFRLPQQRPVLGKLPGLAVLAHWTAQVDDADVRRGHL